MHIPTGMMEGAVCPVSATVAAAGIGAAAWVAAKSRHKPDALRFASVSALVFAGQLLNFPIQNGTSGHLLGGVLASALLGTPFGILSIALVLAVQCLLFSDGGLAVLGANMVNLSLLGAGVGGLLAGRIQKTRLVSLARLGAVAWFSVLLAAFACSAELALAGAVPFPLAAPALLGTHAVIGLGEALLTVLAFALLPSPAPDSRTSALVPTLATVLIALVLSPFASGFPDGLEWVANRLGFLHKSAPAFVAPFADYSLAASLPEGLSTGLAGLAGVLVVFVLGCAVSMSWNPARRIS